VSQILPHSFAIANRNEDIARIQHYFKLFNIYVLVEGGENEKWRVTPIPWILTRGHFATNFVHDLGRLVQSGIYYNWMEYSRLGNVVHGIEMRKDTLSRLSISGIYQRIVLCRDVKGGANAFNPMTTDKLLMPMLVCGIFGIILASGTLFVEKCRWKMKIAKI
jgi:hypothetical protein